MTDFLVKRDELRECRIAEAAAPELEAGQALLRVDTFGMTANNVTYAVFGEAMSYWDFFPAEDGWGRVPIWGFAEVERSEAEGVEPGTRLYGYLPPSSHLVVDAGRRRGEPGSSTARRTGRRCPRPTTATLPTDADSFYRADTEAIQMLLRPLFFTSFLIDDQLDDEGLAARGPIVISSASSKTAIAAAFLLAQRDGVELVGLDLDPATPSSSRASGSTTAPSPTTRSIRSSAVPATFVDVAGDGEVRHAVHSHFGDELLHSMAVGVTHWEELGSRRPAICRARRPPSSSPPTGSASAPRTGAAPSSRRAWPTPGTRSASGPAAGSRRFPARASRPCRMLISTCSRAGSSRSAPTC